MSKPVAILGGGGHARVVMDTLRLAGFEILGVVDPKSDVHLPVGIRHLGVDLSAINPDSCDLALGVGSIDVGARNPRPRLFAEAKAAGFAFVQFRHPSALVAGDVAVAEGVQIMAGSVIQPGVSLGQNVIVNTSASLDHDCRVGDHVHVAPGVVLSGDVDVGNGVHLGTGAIVIHGVRIGAEAMIGAGVVVTETVAAGTRLRPQK
jgi:UDP-perosamine 4-acetyltransferase